MKKIVIPAAVAAAGLAAAVVVHKRNRAKHEEKPYGAWRN